MQADQRNLSFYKLFLSFQKLDLLHFLSFNYLSVDNLSVTNYLSFHKLVLQPIICHSVNLSSSNERTTCSFIFLSTKVGQFLQQTCTLFERQIKMRNKLFAEGQISGTCRALPVPYAVFMITEMTLRFRTNRSGQTVQILIRLLLRLLLKIGWLIDS